MVRSLHARPGSSLAPVGSARATVSGRHVIALDGGTRAPRARASPSTRLLVLALGCGSPPSPPAPEAGPGPDAPAEQPLAVVFAGCDEVLRGPLCTFDPHDGELRLWAEVDPGLPVVLSLDGVPVAAPPEPVDGGQRWVIRPPATARRLALWADLDGATGRFELALDPSPAPVSAALAEIEALDDPAQGRERLEALLPSLSGAERAHGLRLVGDLAFERSDLEAVTAAYAEGVEVAAEAGRIRDASTMAQRLVFVCIALRHDEACGQRWLERDASLVVEDPEQRMLHAYYAGLLAVHRGELHAALTAHRSSERQAHALGLPALEAAALLEQMLLVGRVGAWERAQGLRERALELLPALEPTQRGQLLNAAAWVLLEAHGRGHPTGEDPLPLLERALAVLDGRTDPIAAHTRHAAALNLAYAATLRGHAPEARRWLEGVDEAALDPEDRLWRLLLLARVALLEGHPTLAGRRFATLLSEAERLYEPELRWQALVGQGQVHEAHGRPEDALASYAAAERVLVEQLPRIALGEGRARFIAERDRGTRRWIDLLVRLGRPEQALCVARLARTRALRALADALRLARASPAQHEALRRYREARARLEAAYDESWTLPAAVARQRQRALARQRLDGRRALDELFDAIDPGRDVAMRCDDLPPPGAGTVDLHLVQLDDAWIGFAVDARGVTLGRLGPLEPPTVASAARWASWGRTVLEPFSEALGRAERVRVMPSGALMRVPFHALPDPIAPEHALVERVTVTHGLDLPTRASAPGRAPQGPAVLVAPPSNLLHAPAELAAVAGLLEASGWSVQRLEGDAAQGDAVRGALPSAGLLHYLGHAEPDDLGQGSTLRLARDGALEVGDVLALPRVPSLVVLNGCETGRTDPRAAAGGMSLAHAFVLAGAELVVASDQVLDDAAGAAFARAFHEALATGASAPEALSAAQRQRQGRDDGWLHMRGWVP